MTRVLLHLSENLIFLKKENQKFIHLNLFGYQQRHQVIGEVC